TARAPETKAPMNGMYAVTKVTTAIVPARGTSKTRAHSPTKTALNAEQIVTPRKYLRSERMTLSVIVVATARGTPRLRSMKARMAGPSFRRKNVLKNRNVKKKTSDVRA